MPGDYGQPIPETVSHTSNVGTFLSLPILVPKTPACVLGSSSHSCLRSCCHRQLSFPLPHATPWYSAAPRPSRLASMCSSKGLASFRQTCTGRLTNLLMMLSNTSWSWSAHSHSATSKGFFLRFPCAWLLLQGFFPPIYHQQYPIMPRKVWISLSSGALTISVKAVFFSQALFQCLAGL